MLEKEEKFNELVAQNTVRIQRICSYYNSDADDRKDMFQEVLINIWNSLDRFRGDSAINTWIYRIAVNTALSYTGKAYKYMQLIVNVDTQNLSAVFDEDSYEDKQNQEVHFEKFQYQLNLYSE